MPGEVKVARGLSVLPALTAGEAGVAVVQLDVPDDLLLLGDDVAELWRNAVAELEPRGLRPVDLEAIRQMVMAAWSARALWANVAAYGHVVEGARGGPILNPASRAAEQAAATYQRIAAELGLTFASRLRLGLMQLAGQSLLQQLNATLDAD